jgi:predicted SprT family Zn-dependent metalloprotease
MNLEQAQIVAESLMELYGLIAKGWKFEWDDSKRRAGCCHFLNGKRITLSRSITEANPRTHLVNTTLHEIAHALTGPAHNHDREWKQIARRIGCTADRCYTKGTRQPPAPWVAACPKCGNSSRTYHRRSLMSCGKCNPKKFDGRFVMLSKRASKLHAKIEPGSQQMKLEF